MLGTGESAEFGIMRAKSIKLLMFCDACRKVERITQLSESMRIVANYEKKSADYPRPRYRLAFDEQVRIANPGVFCMYACNVNEYAYEDPLNGAYFTIGLIEQAAQWWNDCTDNRVLLVQRAFDKAQQIVKMRKPMQNPVAGPENKSGNDFPFAVCIKR